MWYTGNFDRNEAINKLFTTITKDVLKEFANYIYFTTCAFESTVQRLIRKCERTNAVMDATPRAYQRSVRSANKITRIEASETGNSRTSIWNISHSLEILQKYSPKNNGKGSSFEHDSINQRVKTHWSFVRSTVRLVVFRAVWRGPSFSWKGDSHLINYINKQNYRI